MALLPARLLIAARSMNPHASRPLPVTSEGLNHGPTLAKSQSVAATSAVRRCQRSAPATPAVMSPPQITRLAGMDKPDQGDHLHQLRPRRRRQPRGRRVLRVSGPSAGSRG